MKKTYQDDFGSKMIAHFFEGNVQYGREGSRTQTVTTKANFFIMIEKRGWQEIV